MLLSGDLVEWIFAQLAITYGTRFLAQWDGIDLNLVKAQWAHELGAFRNSPQAIKHALESLPSTWPPTVIGFKILCNTAPKYFPKPLPAPKESPEQKAKVRTLLLETRARLIAQRSTTRAGAIETAERNSGTR